MTLEKPEAVERLSYNASFVNIDDRGDVTGRRNDNDTFTIYPAEGYGLHGS